jgi:hypothetical protein
MTSESANSQKLNLAFAVAEGKSVAEWAHRNEVPERTAYRWAAEPEVRAEVESIRRRALDQAIGQMATHSSWVVNRMLLLGDNARSESVQLSALRGLLADYIAVTKFAGLERRVGKLEERAIARAGGASLADGDTGSHAGDRCG